MQTENHIEVVDLTDGNIKIATYASGFGEPNGDVVIMLDEPNGCAETHRTISVDNALLIANKLIRIAKFARAKRKAWVRQHKEFIDPLVLDNLDIEDKGAI